MWNSEKKKPLAFLRRWGHPPPSQNRSAGDKPSKQLPLLTDGPMKWILFVLTHILHATVFMLPIQEPASLNLSVNRTPGRRILSLRLTVWILVREKPEWLMPICPFFSPLLFWETGRVCSKRRCRQRRSHPGFLRALLLSVQPRLRRLSPRRNCMLAETIGLIEYIPQKVLGYSSLVYLIDDICLPGRCHVIFITLLFEK